MQAADERDLLTVTGGLWIGAHASFNMPLYHAVRQRWRAPQSWEPGGAEHGADGSGQDDQPDPCPAVGWCG
jgi:hypothetical protein